jgi:hypothetical protein
VELFFVKTKLLTSLIILLIMWAWPCVASRQVQPLCCDGTAAASDAQPSINQVAPEVQVRPLALPQSMGRDANDIVMLLRRLGFQMNGR